MPEISVIIPIYKVEPYLRRCLDSVLSQTFTDYECIMVDDGSPDNCPVICDEYLLKDNRFKVLHKKQNEGLPGARKSGLDIAEGGFVFHLDSDDWIEKDALELLYKKQQETNADIVLGGMKIFYPFKIKEVYYHTLESNMTVMSYCFLYYCLHLVGKLYRKTLFLNYIVPEMNIGEDIITSIQLFYKLPQDKFCVLDKIIYNYDCCANGMTNNLYISSAQCENYYDYPSIKSRLWVEKYLENIKLTENELSAFQCFMIRNGINPYLKHSKKINKSDVNVFYNKYYKTCNYKSKIRFFDRIITPVFYHSMLAGKIYVLVLNAGIKLIISFLTLLRKWFSI